MTPLPTRFVQSRGFTLLEIMVVVFIIGIIITFASLSISQHGDRYTEDEAKRLHHLLRLATEEAVFRGQELSLLITEKGYSFAMLSGPKWEPIVDDPFFRSREFPETVKVTMTVYDQEVNLGDPDKPVQIYILSSGEVTPFSISLTGESRVVYTITGNLTGKIAYLPPETKDGSSG